MAYGELSVIELREVWRRYSAGEGIPAFERDVPGGQGLQVAPEGHDPPMPRASPGTADRPEHRCHPRAVR